MLCVSCYYHPFPACGCVAVYDGCVARRGEAGHAWRAGAGPGHQRLGPAPAPGAATVGWRPGRGTGGSGLSHSGLESQSATSPGTRRTSGGQEDTQEDTSSLNIRIKTWSRCNGTTH